MDDEPERDLLGDVASPPPPPDPVFSRRLVEALLFASAEPLSAEALRAHLPDGVDLPAVLADLARRYEGGGVSLERVAGGWAFRTAADLAPMLRHQRIVHKRLSRAAIEVLAVIAYHQPVSRADVEAIRGVALGQGTLAMLLETGWVKPVGRRDAPGRPMTWGTTPAFLDHFGLNALGDLPNVEELRAAGLLDRRQAITLAMRAEDAEPGLELEPDEPLDET